MTKVQQCVSQYRNINFSTKIKVEISNGTFFFITNALFLHIYAEV